MYVRCPPCNSGPLPHFGLSWILSKLENLESSILQDEATDWLFFSEFLCPTLIINLAQLIYPGVALLAELVSFCCQWKKRYTNLDWTVELGLKFHKKIDLQ